MKADFMGPFLAHSAPDGNLAKGQPLAAHLEAVADRAERFAAKFGAGEMGRVAGLLHDIGKYSEEFQRKLRGETLRVDHSTAGARIAETRFGQIGRLLAYIIAGHHAGLANGSGDGPPSPLEARLSAGSIASLKPYDLWRAEIAGSLPARLEPPPLKIYPSQEIAKQRRGLSMALFARMLFSALIDADRLDTEEFKLTAVGKPAAPRGGWSSDILRRLKERIDRHLEGLAAKAANAAASALSADVNAARAEVLAVARQTANNPPGLFSLTVPTGGGKTLSSLAFALEHAAAHPGRFDRVIYVIPFTSIIEQTARVFREALGDLADCVVEHHSAYREPENERDESEGQSIEQRASLATENWDAPIVVTTAVQFFESLFSNRTSQCRKLHNIAKSVVILDEAQTLPLNLLRPCVAALDELARNYGTSVVLCTATQPALEARRKDGSEGFKGGFEGVREIVKKPEELYDRLRRVTVKAPIILTDETLAERLKTHDKVLCIVGTRAHARSLYRALETEPGTYHLSALMCPAHRSKKLDEIKAALKDGPCRVIATTVVEAGVDIDFPAVYRIMAGLDSIAQAAGRCNREGKHAADDSIVQVFEIEGRKPIPELRKFEQAARAVMRDGALATDLLLPKAIEAYFGELYWGQQAGADDKLDRYGFARGENHVVNRNNISIPFADIARGFTMIETGMEPVIVPYDDEARRLIEHLGTTEDVKAIARKLQRYMVNVPRGAFAELRRMNRIEPVNPFRFEDRFLALTEEGKNSLYREVDGFDFSDATYQGIETLVM